MNLKKLKQKVKYFELKADFVETEFETFMNMFQEEIDILKANKDNKAVVDH